MKTYTSAVNVANESRNWLATFDEKKLDENKYKSQVTWHAIFVSLVFVVSGAMCMGLGDSSYDGQIVGLGIMLLLFGLLHYVWEKIKLYVLEGELATHNRSLVPAYRAMRIFAGSNVMLAALRSIYMMTVSALSRVIMDSIDKDDRKVDLYFAFGKYCYIFHL